MTAFSLTYARPAILVALFAALTANAEESIDFVRDIRPIFEKYCYECHGTEKQKSGLRLDVKSSALKGGEYFQPNIHPGDPNKSNLLAAVKGKHEELRMPPKGDLISAEETAKLEQWIEQGAVWPDGIDKVKLKDPLDHWAFKPVAPQTRPETEDKSWGHGAIDSFILHRLEQEKLTPNPAADRRTWIRRVTFDLTGLPPTPAEVSDFLSDQSDNAFEKVVERLLSSQSYGERWAQHWLDLVRYADTHGFEVNTPRPNAWPYRDYVIAAFNADTPYDQFIREQIAGDHFGKQEATGFLVTAAALLPGQIGKDAASMRLARQDELGEVLNNVGEALLGLSIGCARCHDHKFDPISAEDYYEMQAYFSGVTYGDVRVKNNDTDSGVAENLARLAPIEKQLSQLFPVIEKGRTRPSVSTVANVERFDPVTTKRVRLTIESTIFNNRREPCIDEFEIFDTEGRNVALNRLGAKVTASGSNTQPNRHELRLVNDGVYGNSSSWMSNQVGKGWLEFELKSPTKIERIVWGRDRQGKFDDRLAQNYRIEYQDADGEWSNIADSSSRADFEPDKVKRNPFNREGFNPDKVTPVGELLSERAKIQKDLSIIAGGGRPVFSGKFIRPQTQFLLRRGDPELPQHEVQPATLVLQPDAETTQAPKEERERRLAISNWIASPDNPLTARVMVNRIWQWHFGTAIVNTPNDFGNSGAQPSHPELLDWLAAEFIRSGWSMKHLHRLIVLSATYRQSNTVRPDGLKADAGNRLLWRFPSRRLEGEAIRDSILALSGRLNRKAGGPGFDLFKSRGGLSGFPPIEEFGPEGRRRLIYAHKVRMEREIVFGAFDCPDGGQSTPKRNLSTTPIQALNLFNSKFTAAESKALATRLKQEAGSKLTDQVNLLWTLVYSRLPESDIRSEAVTFVREHGLASLCRTVFNSNEFLFLP